jgi:hypothetical protein
MDKLYRVLLLLVFFGLGIPCASAADTILFNPQTTQMDIGSSQNVEVVMDEVPEGLAGFNITISVLDPEIAEITAVTLPDWCVVIEDPIVPSSSVTIEVIDLFKNKEPGATNVLLGTITLTGKKAGTSDLNISEGSTYDSDNSEFVYIIPGAIPGKVDVLDKEAPVINSVNLNNSNPNTGDYILVTVDATDNVGVSSVKANDVSLLNQEGNIWNGSITALAGTHFVNVSAMDGAGNITWHNSTSYMTNKSTPTITWSNPVDITYGTALSGDQLNAVATDPEGNTVAGNFAYNPAEGTVLGVGAGQPLHAEFTPADTENYTTASKDVTISVSKSNPTITWNNPVDITYGTALSGDQLNAVATDPEGNTIAGSFVYTPAAGTILDVGNDQPLHAEFTPADAGSYTTASKDVTINVSKSTPTITWNNPADIVYGTELSNYQLNAAASVPGDFTYTPAEGTVLGAGNDQKLHADFAPADSANYTTASKDVQINVLEVPVTPVEKLTPTITWNNPADITFGTALSDIQLNAEASVPGTFTYTPAGGALLNVGTHTLHVDFTPEDAQNYNITSKDVQINVIPVPPVAKVTPTITWNSPADITFGTALSDIQLNPVAKDPVTGNTIEGTYTYTPAAGTVLEVGNGQNLHVDFTPADTATYTNATANVTINVLENIEQPVIDVNQPEIQSVTLFPANTTAGSKIDISVNIKNNTEVAKVMADNAQLMNVDGNWQGNITAPSSPGRYSLSVKADDAAGNTVDTSVPYEVVRRHGSVNIEILPIVNKVVAGENTNLAIKVKNTQNIDDTFKVRISVNGLPAFYRAGASWFDWTEKTVNLKANEEVLIPIEMKVPVGTVTGLKVLKGSVNSEKFSVHGSDNGYLVISHPTKNINKQIGPKGLWLGHKWIS